MSETHLRHPVLMEQNEDGGYIVMVPSLSGCVSEGSTRDEALAHIEEAIAGYVEVARETRQTSITSGGGSLLSGEGRHTGFRAV
ncbi:MAG TPA: type II toxin-antitoxin system HicB family antitoxin [Methanoculleus sp.]|nr:type II toxin-antitoxin system HicB family antitoxin [Methanoculleus sp.]